MSKLNLVLAFRLFAAAIVLFLVSCGGQPVKSEDDAPAVKQADADAIKAVVPQKEQEPPSVELIPRKDRGEPKISMEPLPADEPVEEPEKQPEASMESPAVDAKSQDAVVKEVTKEEPPLVVAPAVKPVPAPVVPVPHR